MTQKVTPWEVKGKIDYEKLIKEFGLKPLSHLPEVFQKNVLFRRGIIFAHRDFKQIVEAIENKKPFVMMTGLMPSGKFHFGHKMVAEQIIFYQKTIHLKKVLPLLVRAEKALQEGLHRDHLQMMMVLLKLKSLIMAF